MSTSRRATAPFVAQQLAPVFSRPTAPIPLLCHWKAEKPGRRWWMHSGPDKLAIILEQEDGRREGWAVSFEQIQMAVDVDSMLLNAIECLIRKLE